jgi:hypothetical protein
VSGRVELWAALPQTQRDPAFPTPARQAAVAAEIERLGVEAALWMLEPAGETAVGGLAQRFRLPVNAVVPNMRAYLRDASDYGVVGAALQRFRCLGLLDQARIALHNLPRAPRVLARDFATGVLVMVEMELARLRRLTPTYGVLNASVTDLALALDQRRLIADFVALTERAYGLRSALATYNYGILVERLGAWGVRPGAVLAPFNPRGYLMNPSRQECEWLLKGSPIDVVATHVEVDGLVGLPEAVEYLSGLGIGRAVLELAP